MKWRIRKSFKIFAPGSSLQKRVAYSLAIVRLILAPLIFLAIYYLFAMGRIVDRIVNIDAPAAKLAEQASIEMLEARRAARNYTLFQDREYLQTSEKSLTSLKQDLVRIGDVEPDDETVVQQGLDAATLYQQRFVAAVSILAKSKQEPVDRIREAVAAYEKDLDDLVKTARHERRAQLIQELRTRAGSLDARIIETIQAESPSLRRVTTDLHEPGEQILQLTSELEKRNWERVRVDHEKARGLIHRADWGLGIVSAITFVFSVWVSFILPRQVVQPLVSLKQAVDHAATGNYEVDFELHGGGEIVELAKSVKNLTTLLRGKPQRCDGTHGHMHMNAVTKPSLRVKIPASAIVATAVVWSLGMMGEAPKRFSNPLEIRANNHTLSLTLHAAIANDGKNSFYFNGRPNAPTLRLSPGDQLKITYVNDLPAKPKESCAIAPCMDMTNLHFHGLTISPDAPQDNVLDMMAMPGQSLRYTVQIPKDHPPGLYWYHTHPHGESHRQALDGMSGALVIEGIESYFPPLAGLPERVLVVRGRSIVNDPQSADLKHRVELSWDLCGSEPETPGEIFTLNGSVRPQIEIAPGERQFWRLVNASADRYLDLQLEGETFEVVAMDGMPIAQHDPNHRTRSAGHVLLPPAGRVEAIVTGPAAGTPKHLVSRCVDTGPDGDPNPAMVLADIVSRPAPESVPRVLEESRKPDLKTLDLAAEEQAPPQFTVTFTEDKKGFYINGEKFAPGAAPMVRPKIGTLQHWRIVNATKELHPMHIHQVHFLPYAENDRPIVEPVWLDTVNVPYGGSVDVIMDFTNPVIKGMSVFHCHLLNHEDKGMMAKILFQ
jgi:suppressor of ftsI